MIEQIKKLEEQQKSINENAKEIHKLTEKLLRLVDKQSQELTVQTIILFMAFQKM